MDWLTDPQIWLAFATLTTLEIVLAIDNIIFISILVNGLPKEQQERARRYGIAFALITRLMLLASLAWLVKLTEPLFVLQEHAVSPRDLVLLIGGVFLIYKATAEIHNSLEGPIEMGTAAAATRGFLATILQIGIIDIIFSLDSVITAVGLVNQLPIMVAAIMVAMVLMLFATEKIGEIIDTHPTIKMLAFSFLMLVGFTLVAEGAGLHIPKGYIYFAMAFSIGVELLNTILRKKKANAVVLRNAYIDNERADNEKASNDVS